MTTNGLRPRSRTASSGQPKLALGSFALTEILTKEKGSRALSLRFALGDWRGNRGPLRDCAGRGQGRAAAFAFRNARSANAKRPRILRVEDLLSTFPALQDRAYERAGSARKRPSAEGVDCVGSAPSSERQANHSFDLVSSVGDGVNIAQRASASASKTCASAGRSIGLFGPKWGNRWPVRTFIFRPKRGMLPTIAGWRS